MRPLKIMHLIASLSLGGGERLVLELAQHTNRDLFTSYVCAIGQFSKQTLLPKFQELGNAFYIVPSHKFYNLEMFRAIMAHIREQQIDVLHTHLIDADIVGGFLGRFLKIPVITTLHNAPQNYNHQRKDRRILAQLAARYATTHLVAVSEHIRHLFIQEWHTPPDRISSIRNGIVLDRFLSIAPGTTAVTPLTITNIASLTPQKAQHLLLEAAKIVLTEMPSVNFIIVGIGELKQALEAQAQALGISDRVTFTGLRHDIPDILAQSDIFVLSSLWEGLPVSAIEAMAAARAVVLTDVGGNHELVESGRYGLIVPSNDVPALAQSLLQLLRDEPARLSMGQAARTQVQQAFSMETFMRQYETVYLTVWQQYHRQIIPAHVTRGAA